MSGKSPPAASIDPAMLLNAYRMGVFPMADSREDEGVHWVEPRRRGILPLDQFHLSKSLAKSLKTGGFELTVDQAFDQVIVECAAPGPGRESTWINRQIEVACHELFAVGRAHSIECWRGGKLVGGLYGVRLGGAFFGESMFSRVTDASKVALAALVARMRVGGFTLLDCQFLTAHLASLGAIEIDRETYSSLLSCALSVSESDSAGPLSSFAAADGADFFLIDASVALPPPPVTELGPTPGMSIWQSLVQTS